MQKLLKIIKKLCHPGLDSGYHKGITKLGAMFGLDARIALAIFGALSVISGAALYSAIQEAKVVAIVADLNEIGKAYDQYLLDVSSELPIAANSIYVKTEALVEDTATGWKGPYINYETATSDHVLYYPSYSVIFLAHALDEDWPIFTGTGYSALVACVANKICSVYAGLDGLDQITAEAVDKYIDGVVDYDSGSLRVFPLSGNWHIFLKLRPAVNQL